MLKVGDEIKGKNDYEYRVISVGENGVAVLSAAAEHVYWITNEELQRDFNLPKERWIPTKGEASWQLNDEGNAYCSTWMNDSIDDRHRTFLNVYPTKEAAEAAAEKIKKFVAENL